MLRKVRDLETAVPWGHVVGLLSSNASSFAAQQRNYFNYNSNKNNDICSVHTRPLLRYLYWYEINIFCLSHYACLSGKKKWQATQNSCLERPMDSGDWQAIMGLQEVGQNLATKLTTTTRVYIFIPLNLSVFTLLIGTGVLLYSSNGWEPGSVDELTCLVETESTQTAFQ